VVGEAGGARRQARRARLRVGLVAALALVAGWSCASTGDPPGGPPDTTPPTLLSSAPDSGAVLAAPPDRVELRFDEVIAERIAAQQPTIAGAVLISPTTTPVSVDWHRNRITISVRGGFRPGRIYRVELLPVIVDLRQNKMKTGRTIVFSTGPAIPAATLEGTVVDWTGGRAAAGALVEAVLLPDSLPYLAQSDSVGHFSLAEMPPGDYLVYGIVDQNNNRRRDPREAFDTARVALADSAAVELYAFTHDTVGPRLRSAELADSVTLRLGFDRPISTAVAVDTSMVRVSPAADTTEALPLLRVYTTAAFDSARAAETAARAAAQAARDSAARAQAAARDTTGRPPVPGAARPPAARPVPPPPLAQGPRRDTALAARRDSSRAMKMLARRPAPSDTRVVRLTAPLVPGTRYVVTTHGVVGLTGVVAATPGRTMLTVPRPRAPDAGRPKTGVDSAPPAGSPPGASATPAPADSLRRARADTTGARRDTVPPPPRPR
jgi:hypothetical protein